MKNGFVKIDRDIVFDELWQSLNANQRLVMLVLICRASYKPEWKFFGEKKIQIKIGEVLTTRQEIAFWTGLTESTVYRSLLKLEKLGFCNLRANNNRTIISVEKWALHQGKGIETEQQPNNDRTTTEQRPNNLLYLKNNKNNKNLKNIYIGDERYQSKEYKEEMEKRINRPLPVKRIKGE